MPRFLALEDQGETVKKNGENKARLWRQVQILPHFACYATIQPLFGEAESGDLFRLWCGPIVRAAPVPFVEQGIEIMRKIVLAAAIATSALGLAACGETADSVSETGDAMAADAESIADEATAAGEEVADAAGEAADATAEAAGDAADATAEAADAAAAAAEEMVEGE